MMSAFGMGSAHLLMIVFWIVIIGGAIWLLAALFPQAERPTNDEAGSSKDALTILKRRYARGEVSKEEFETIRRDLEDSATK